MKTPQQILTEAADLIERNGKARGKFYGYGDSVPLADRPMCALGAIGFVASGNPESFALSPFALSVGLTEKGAATVAVKALGRAVSDEYPMADTIQAITSWSDGNTAEAVVFGLRNMANAMGAGAK